MCPQCGHKYIYDTEPLQCVYIFLVVRYNAGMSKIVMVHEMHPEMFIPENCVVTLDDGLYTQYLHGRGLQNKKIFFISSGIVCYGPQSDAWISAPDAHKKAFRGNKENYMTVAQIRELHEMGCEIGGHSHNHFDMRTLSGLPAKIHHIENDTNLMMTWFRNILGFEPTSFCFPYNYELNGIYRFILKRKYGFTDFYGADRINIDDISA